MNRMKKNDVSPFFNFLFVGQCAHWLGAIGLEVFVGVLALILTSSVTYLSVPRFLLCKIQIIIVRCLW